MKARMLLVLLITISFLIVGCDNKTGTVSSKEKSQTASEQSKKPSEQTKAAKADKELNTETIISAFKNAGMPIGEVANYTEDNDPNSLLGRPGQYIQKSSWADARVEQPDPEFDDDPIGGTVEIFKSDNELQKRKAYIEEIAEGLPMAVQYFYVKGKALVRIHKDLTPSEAAEYEKVLQKL